jgi:hypothetical protein
MAYTYRQLMDAANNADKAGDNEAAQEYYNAAQSRKGADTPTVEEPKSQFWGGTQDAAANAVEATPSLVAASGEAIGDFGRSVKKGMQDIGLHGTRLYAQATDNQDLLATINMTRHEENKSHKYVEDRSPVASFLGDAVGEGLALGPLGGVGAAGGKVAAGLVAGGLKKAMVGATTAVALEGAGAGFLTSEGDTFGERTGDAAIGAGLNVAGGAVIKGVASTAGAYARRLLNQGKINDDIANEIATKITPRVDSALVDGGYVLDGNTAAGTSQSLNEIRTLRTSPDAAGDKLRLFESQQEVQIEAFAKGFVERYGPVAGKHSEDANRVLADALSGARDADQKTFTDAYSYLDELAKTQNFILPNKAQLAKDIESIDFEEGAESLAPKVKNIFARYGVGTNLTPQNSAEYLTKRLESGRESQQLTFGTYEKMRQELNSFYSAGKLNSGEKKLIHDAKEMLDGFILAATNDPKIGGSAVARQAEKARGAFSDFNDKWSTKELVSRIANSSSLGDGRFGGPSVNLGKAVRTLSNNQDTRGITKVKAALLGVEGGEDVWLSLQQAPLLEAFEAAMKPTLSKRANGNVVVFNNKAFEASLNSSMTRDSRKALWGEEMTTEIDKAIVQWANRDISPSSQLRVNGSGTAFALLHQLRFIPTGLARKGAQLTAAVGDKVVDAGFGRRMREEAVGEATDGGMTSSMTQQLADEAAAIFEEQYRGGGAGAFSKLITQSLSRGIIFSDDENK